MTLYLDARQRAMLLEMGVRVWQAPRSAALAAPEPEAAPTSALPTDLQDLPKSRGDQAATKPPSASVPPSLSVPGTPSPSAARLSGSALPPPHAAGGTAPLMQAPAVTSDAGSAPGSWNLLPTRLLYPDANPALTPSHLGAGWIVITQAVDPREPWAESAERLLHAMLQALQLHLHPRVALCALQGHAAGAPGASDITADIAAQVAAFAPSVVLVMGRVAVRAALGTTDPLTKLREQSLRIAGVPAIATYDAPFLLRNPLCKRPAWADLCHALELVGAPAV